MLDAGLFAGKRVELVGGEIYEMTAMKSPHATAVTLTADALRNVFSVGYIVRVRCPLDLGEESQPEPDVAVVQGAARDYRNSHPTTAALIVEIADTTINFDRFAAIEQNE